MPNIRLLVRDVSSPNYEINDIIAQRDPNEPYTASDQVQHRTAIVDSDDYPEVENGNFAVQWTELQTKTDPETGEEYQELVVLAERRYQYDAGIPGPLKVIDKAAQAAAASQPSGPPGQSR